MIVKIFLLGLIFRTVSSASTPTLGKDSDLKREGDTFQMVNLRRLSFREKNNLFEHKTDIGKEEEEDWDIGGPANLMGDYDGLFDETKTQAGIIGQPNDSDEDTATTHLHDTQSDTINKTYFDGFEVTEQAKPTEYFDGFQIDKEAENPDFFDGFEINSDKNLNNVSSKYEKRAHVISNKESNESYYSFAFRTPFILLFVGLAVTSIIMFLIHRRDMKMIKKAEQKEQERIDRLKNLYEGLDKSDDGTRDSTVSSKGSPPSTPRRLVAIHMGDNDCHTVEKIDFINADIEYGESLSTDSDDSFKDDMPALTMRMVRKNSGSPEHWIKYSSDEFTIDSDSSSDSNDRRYRKKRNGDSCARKL